MAFDLTSKVITEYSADASEHIAELKKLKDKITETQKAELEAHEKRNATYESWLKNITTINQGLEIAEKAIDVAKESWKEYAENLRLTAAAGTANIERLRAASLGLRTENELLSFAAKTQHGVIKVSQEQMETAQRAMIALTRAGFDQEEVTNKITDAMISLKTKGLDDLGIAMTNGKTDAETFGNLMDALAKKANGVDTSTTTAGESIQQMGVSMRDSFDKMKHSLGELVAAMAPLLDALARAVGLIAEATTGVLAKVPTSPGEIDALLKKRQDILSMINNYRHGGFRPGEFFGAGENEAGQDYWANNAGAGTVDEATFYSFMNGRFKKPSKATDVSQLVKIGGYDRMGSAEFKGSLGAAAGISVDDQKILEQIDAMRTGDLTKDWFARLEEQRNKKTSFLEASFGKLEDFNAYHQAFQMLTGATTAAIDAWITGSMTAGQAIKKFIGEALKSLASQMAIEALKHTAYAIGSAAFGDYGGAAKHATAAVAFGVGAAAAATAAKAMGGGAPVGTSAGGSASAGASGGSPSFGGTKQATGERTIVVIGDSFSRSSPRMAQLEAERVVDLAYGGNGVTHR